MHFSDHIRVFKFCFLKFLDRVRVATRSHAPPRHAPGHAERVRGRHRVRPVPVCAALGQQSSDASDRAHVRRLQGLHVLLVFGDIHRAHGPAGPHDRRPLQRDAAVRLPEARLPGQVLLHRRARSAHPGTPRTGRSCKRECTQLFF